MKRLYCSAMAFLSGVLTIITLEDHFPAHPRLESFGETIFSVVCILYMLLMSLYPESRHD